jgi:hypothetical protein
VVTPETKATPMSICPVLLYVQAIPLVTLSG